MGNYEESKNYTKYYTLTRFTEEELVAFRINRNMSRFGKEWMEWAESVKEEINSLEDKYAEYLLDTMKNSYQSAMDQILKQINEEQEEKDPMPYVGTFAAVTSAGINKDLEVGICAEAVYDQWMDFEEDSDNGSRLNKQGNLWYFKLDGYQDFEQAVSIYKEAAKYNNLDALNNLGNCYFFGNGVLKNDNMAFQYYKAAADQGHIIGKSNLAMCYLEGIGTEKNIKKAFSLYQETEKSNNPDLWNWPGFTI